MKNFFIIYNRKKENAKIIAEQFKNLIIKNGGNAIIDESKNVKKPFLYTDPCNVPFDTQCIISIGGDGTLIRAARDMASLNIPLVAVNSGHLGFLAEIEEDDLENAAYKLTKDKFYIENRMRLSLNLQKNIDDEVILFDTALNDVVISKSEYFGILNIDIYVDGQHLNSYNADGIIISTPTGSTGYSLSAGGPIVDPKADMILITPINPHTLNFRSIVLSGDAEVKIKLNKRDSLANINAYILCDGDNIGILSYDYVLNIKKADISTKILKLNTLSFIKIIGNKMKDE